LFDESNMFHTRVYLQERIKRMDMTGITENEHDIWDKKVEKTFSDLADEVIKRIEEQKENE
ncbi:ParA family protein, partial [Lactobacillus iners]|nr:ParA family protein [Lactobacillus iners]